MGSVMLPRLLLLFTLVPIAELAVLIQVGRWVGLWPTLALVIGTGILGATLTRREGLRAWRAFQLEMWEGRVPGRPILDGLSIFVGGALLLTPGLMTDVAGFALLARPSRRWIQDLVLRRVRRLVGDPSRHVRVRTWFGDYEPPHEPGDRDGPRGREIEFTNRPDGSA